MLKDNNIIKFRGAIHSIKIDKEGETRLTLDMSLSEIAQMRKLSECLETLLEIKIKPER